MVLDSNLLSGAVSSFKEFLNVHDKDDSRITSNIKEDMRHFLRLVKYHDDSSLKEIKKEIADSLDELYNVIVIELNAIDINNFVKKDKEPTNGKVPPRSINQTNDKEIILVNKK